MKSILFFAALALVFLNGINAQNVTCSSFTTCGLCTANVECGWCGPTATCSAGGRSGPNTGNCYGNSWFYNFGPNPNPCPNCKAITDCKTCLYWNSDCKWCQGSSGPMCTEWGTALGCNALESCPCTGYATCSDCLRDTGCFWCGGANASCLNNGMQCDMPAHTCPCNDNIDCGSCLSDSNQGCVWCENAGGGACENSGSGCLLALNCNSFCQTVGTTCSLCSGLTGCGWCANTNQCVDLSVAGTCDGFITHSCPNCAEHRYCDPCQDDGCAWCENGECREVGNTGDCMVVHSCQSYCGAITDCNNCNGVSGCGWCEQTSSCVDADQSNCMLAHSCSAVTPSCSFDGGAFVGGMFLGIGLCAIGVGGFLFYRWRVGKKGGYSELH